MKAPRRQVRPIVEGAMLDKKFKKVIETPKRVSKSVVPIIAVISDLRNGSLVSLDRYLRKEGGIPDRQVALELRKLISGTKARTPFHLLVVDHPDGARDKGGRPKKGLKEPTEQERAIALAYSQRPAGVKVKVHTGNIVKCFGLKSDKAVKRIANKVLEYDKLMALKAEERRLEQADLEQVVRRRQQALDALKSKKSD